MKNNFRITFVLLFIDGCIHSQRHHGTKQKLQQLVENTACNFYLGCITMSFTRQYICNISSSTHLISSIMLNTMYYEQQRTQYLRYVTYWQNFNVKRKTRRKRRKKNVFKHRTNVLSETFNRSSFFVCCRLRDTTLLPYISQFCFSSFGLLFLFGIMCVFASSDATNMMKFVFYLDTVSIRSFKLLFVFNSLNVLT